MMPMMRDSMVCGRKFVLAPDGAGADIAGAGDRSGDTEWAATGGTAVVP
jgi:hypothetical protein